MDDLRTPDFKFVYSNGVGLQMSEDELVLTFGFSEDLAKAMESARLSVGVIMSLKGAKLLQLALNKALGDWEAANREIILPEALLETLEANTVRHMEKKKS